MTTETHPIRVASADSGTTFRSALGRFQRRWRAGLIAAGIMRAVLWSALIFLALGVLDYYAGFGDRERRMASSLMVCVGLGGVVFALWEAWSCSRRKAAAEADRGLASGRREILSALELASADAPTPLAHWLRERTVEKAAAQVGALELRRSLPVTRLAKRLRMLLVSWALIGVLALLAPTAASIIARRLLRPNADIPPYSPLRFAVGPQPAEVMYGGEIVVTATISGAKVEAPVRCLTRDRATGRIEDSPAYRESAERFSLKLEKVDEPVDVAFAVGRARSSWMPVAVRMQPKIQEVQLTVEPPAYSGLPRREFSAGSQDLAALAGSRITARVTSNRPLGAGTLHIHGDDSGPASRDQEMPAEIENEHQVRFIWEVKGSATLALDVRDIAGTASEPVRIEQKLTPDERPDVVLRQPTAEVLATPDGELPLEYLASDDLGLARVNLVRRLEGYRERAQSEPIRVGARRYDQEGKLRLGPLGVIAGQTIELTIEAADTNPTLLGVGVSEPARIHIIAREQYAQMLRDRTTLEDFAGRYEVLRQALEDARKAVDELGRAADSGDAVRIEGARQKAFDAHEKAAHVYSQIAHDFPIFDLDPALSKAAEEVAGTLLANGQQLKELSGSHPDEVRNAVPQLRDRLGTGEKEMAAEFAKGDRAASAAKLFEEAGRFNELLEKQRGLVKDFNRILEEIRRGEMQAGRAIGDLARRQREEADDLRQFEKDLDAAIGGLSDEFAQLKTESEEFLHALRELEIPPVMDEGTKAGEAGDGKTAGERADEALAKLEALLRKQNGFCEMCRGGAKFPWPGDLAQTLQQLMQSLIPKPGSGEGDKPGGTDGSAPGYSGRSESGFAMKGKAPQLPIYGPPRAKLSRSGSPDLAGSGEGRKGGGKPEAGADVKTSQVGTGPVKSGGGEALPIEAAPEAYREALKRYFTPAP